MNHKLIMASSAIILGIIGITCSFLPLELAEQLALSGKNSILLIQIAGALFFGFAMVNWTAKGTLIGGIYNKPISLGNFVHFTIGAITLIKASVQMEQLSVTFLILTLVYVTFAVLFGLINFRHPIQEKSQ